ncbi:MAG: response regulator [Chitinophagaceae bacterium]|nr:response regulator [Chitinophagaceae bacterium]
MELIQFSPAQLSEIIPYYLQVNSFGVVTHAASPWPALTQPVVLGEFATVSLPCSSRPFEGYMDLFHEAEVSITHPEIEDLQIRGKFHFIKNKNCWIFSGAPESHQMLERSIVHAQEAANKAILAKNYFLDSMSYELKTPLNVVKTILDQLQESNLEAADEELVNKASKSTVRLSNVIHDMLDASLIHCGKINLHSNWFSFAQVNDELVKQFSQWALEKGIQYKSSLDKLCHQQEYFGDQKRITQVMQNLIDNAMKYTETGFVGFSIERITDNKSTHSIRITVTDTGLGMTKEFVKMAFTKNSLYHFNAIKKSGGSGLGLSLVKGLVELMGGIITVSSEPSLGTRIVVELPLEVRDVELQCSEKAEGTGKKVLVTDDNEMNRRLASHVLKSQGYQVLEASNGTEVLSVMDEHHPDMIFMDINMPGMDGFETSQYIRKELQLYMPIIALTVNSSDGRLSQYRENGMNDYLAKPYSAGDLKSMLAKWM